MATIEDALRVIISRSQSAARDAAMDCLWAIERKSPTVMQRYNNALRIALHDPSAQFTVEERTLLAQFAGSGESPKRSIPQPVRLTPDERQRLEDAARAENMTLSEYVRSRLFS